MSKRLPGVIAAALVLLSGFAVPAIAVEGTATETHEPAPSIDEIRAQNADNPVADDVLPPEQVEPPSWSQWLYIPLTIVGILMLAMLLLRYLQWQPRFAEERRRRGRR